MAGVFLGPLPSRIEAMDPATRSHVRAFLVNWRSYPCFFLTGGCRRARDHLEWLMDGTTSSSLRSSDYRGISSQTSRPFRDTQEQQSSKMRRQDVLRKGWICSWDTISEKDLRLSRVHPGAVSSGDKVQCDDVIAFSTLHYSPTANQRPS